MDRAEPSPAAGDGGDLFAAGLAAMATLAIYVRSFTNGFVFDDRSLLYANSHIGEWSNFWKSFGRPVWWFRDPSIPNRGAYYRPLENIWLTLNYRLFELNPVGYHAAMIAVQLVAVWLVFRLARELTHSRVAAFLGALLFGLIPIHAGAISWGRSIPLPASAMFQIGALLCFIRRTDAPRRYLSLALFWFALALLSHESPVVFPAIIAAYVFLLEAPEHQRLVEDFAVAVERIKRSVLEAAPFIAVVIAYLILRVSVLGFITRVNPNNDWSAAQLLLTIPEALVRFLVLLALPWRAGPGHELLPAGSVVSPYFYLPLLELGATAVALWLLFRRHPHRRLYLFCAIWVVVALAPVLNLSNLNPVETIQDRFLYLSSVAWCIILGDVAAGFVAAGGAQARLAIPATAALALVYCGYLWRAEHFWHDDLTYFGTCVQHYPESWACRGNLGMELWHTGDLKDAERELEIAAELRPNDPVMIGNLGSLHVVMGRLQLAKAELTRELAISKDAPIAPYLVLAEVSAQLGDWNTSEQMLDHVASMPGGTLAAAKARAKIKLHVDHDSAGAEAALKQVPPVQRDADTWVQLGSLARKDHRLQEALADYDSALRLEPRRLDALVTRAGVLYQLGRRDEALLDTESALSLDPDDRELRELVDRLQKLPEPR